MDTAGLVVCEPVPGLRVELAPAAVAHFGEFAHTNFPLDEGCREIVA